MPTYSIDPLYPHGFRCERCGKVVAEVLPAEAIDLVSLTAQQLTDLYPDAAAEIEAHECGCPAGGRGDVPSEGIECLCQASSPAGSGSRRYEFEINGEWKVECDGPNSRPPNEWDWVAGGPDPRMRSTGSASSREAALGTALNEIAHWSGLDLGQLQMDIASQLPMLDFIEFGDDF